METKNPFKMLGLDPVLVRDLPATALKTVIDSQYVALQKVYHPDNTVTGNQEMSRMLNWAKDQLSNPKQLALWKKNFLDRASRKSASKLLEQAEQFTNQFCSSTLEVLSKIHRESQQQYVDILGIGGRGVVMTPISLDPMAADSARNSFAATLEPDRRREFRERQRKRSKVRLKVNKGKLIYDSVDGPDKYSSHLLVGTISSATILSHFNGSAESIFRFLGLFQGRYETGVARLEGSKSLTEKREWVFRMSAEVFLRLFPLLDFEVSHNCYLFSMQVENGTPFFCLEGHVFIAEKDRE